MHSSDLPNIELIFDELITVEDRDAQLELLGHRCGNDSVLRERVESLLSAYEKGEYLESPFSRLGFDRPLMARLIGEPIGPFKVLELIGEGGMGEVYLARRSQPPAESVAVKVLKPGLNSRQVLARFQLERLLLQQLEHPHIARYVDSGTAANGQVFIAMELVRGLPITEYCDRRRLSLTQRVRLFIDVCSALEHAHQQSIVHRDLKPNNILVSHLAGNPCVKVIDFGVAKAVVSDQQLDTRFTNAVQFLGTPAYMSPEQAEWSSDVDARSDVYALGAILFELLVGSTPVDAGHIEGIPLEEMRRLIVQQERPRPSRRFAGLPIANAAEIANRRKSSVADLSQQLRRDFDWVVLKATERERTQRYASAGQLGMELEAILAGRPTLARAPQWPVRIGKWSRRHARSLKNVSLMFVLVASLFLGARWVERRLALTRNQQAAASDLSDSVQSELKYNRFVADLRRAADSLRIGNEQDARQIIQGYAAANLPTAFDNFAFHYLRQRVTVPQRMRLAHEHDVLDMDVSPDERWLVSGDRGGDIVVTDLETQQCVRRLHPNDKEITRVLFSPDGSQLATVGQNSKVWLWRSGTWEPIAELAGHTYTINGLAWNPSGEWLATGDRGGDVIVWDVKQQTKLQILPRHNGHVRSLSWSPDGRHLATTDDDRALILWRTDNWQQVASLAMEDAGSLAFAFSSDSRYLACCGYFPAIVVYDLESGREAQRLYLESCGWSLAFRSNGDLLVGNDDGRFGYFQKSPEVSEWQLTRQISFSEDRVRLRRILSSQRNEQTIFVVGEQSRDVLRISTASLLGQQTFNFGDRLIGALPELQLVVALDETDGSTKLYRPSDGSLLRELPFTPFLDCPPEYSAVGNLVALAGTDGQGRCVSLWDANSWQLIARIPTASRVRQISFSSDGSHCVLSGLDGGENADTPCMVDVASGRRQSLMRFVEQGAETRAAFAPQASHLILGSTANRKMTSFDQHTLEPFQAIQLDSDFQACRYNQHEGYLLVGETKQLSCYAADLSKKLWSSPSPSAILGIEFSPDGRIAACLCRDGKIRLWDMRSREVLLSLDGTGGQTVVDPTLHWLSFSDPSTLIFGRPDPAGYLQFSAEPPLSNELLSR